jgi:glycosyltransferase involved in cell wall biosynthesis
MWRRAVPEGSNQARVAERAAVDPEISEDAGRGNAQPVGKGNAKVVVVMPAFNAARTLAGTVSAIPTEWVDEIILVDDGSRDETVELARTLPLRVIWHPHNVGYGGNQKTCYLQALQDEADVVVMLHPDGQYEPTLIPELVKPILAGEADLVLGSRLMERGGALAGGMPIWKYIANRALTTIENRALGTSLSELHTGYRAYSRELLMSIPFLRNSLDFSFDSEVLMQVAYFGFRIGEVPVRTIYSEEASSVGPGASIVYGLKTLGAVARLLLHQRGLLRSRKFMP